MTSFDQKRSGHEGGLALLRLDLGERRLDLDLGGVALRQPRGAVGDGRLIGGDPLLVPERDARHQVGALAEGRLHGAVGGEGPALVLDVEAERLREGNRVREVPAVGRHAGAEAGALRHRHAVVRPVVDVQAPGVVEVVLAAGALDRGLLLAVDVEEVVPLAEPAGLGLDDREDGADVVAPPAHVQELVGRAVGRRGQGLPVPGVEVGRVLGERRHASPSPRGSRGWRRGGGPRW